jgi:hypothetical protein
MDNDLITDQISIGLVDALKKRPSASISAAH